jgi:5-methyltetrahydrofolate corrinoid/iron sulfur protein methyltransferase
MPGFTAVGENIHCTRIFKVGGDFVKALDENTRAIVYTEAGREKHLPIAKRFVESSDWQNGKVKHAAVAMWQGLHGGEQERQAGIDYLHHLVRRQEAHGACFLDLNVDEFSTDISERAELVRWAAQIIQQVSTVPLSIDSSNIEILARGLEACDPAKGSPMVNSVSLERRDAVQVAKDGGAVLIAAASGETSMPTNKEGRMANLNRLVSLLEKEGFAEGQIYLDPLVFPVSVDPNNGLMVLEAIEELRRDYGPEIHFAPGLSNISYGMPKRKLINQVFAYLCVQRGLDGGIVDPIQINQAVIDGIDPEAEGFKLAEAFLTGRDQFGMKYISVVREGRL